MKRAVGVLARVRKAGLKPTVEMYNALIDGAGAAGDVALCDELFGQMARTDKLTPSSETYLSLVRGAFAAGDSDRAFQIVDGMSMDKLEPDVAVYNALVSGSYNRELYERGDRVFEQMKADAALPSPTTATYNFVLRSWGARRSMQNMINTVREMDESGVPSSRETYRLLLTALLASNLPQLARNVYEKACAEDIYTPYHARLFHLNLDSFTLPEAKMALLKHFDLLRAHVRNKDPLKDFELINVPASILNNLTKFIMREVLLRSRVNKLDDTKIDIAKDDLAEWIKETQATDSPIAGSRDGIRGAMLSSPAEGKDLLTHTGALTSASESESAPDANFGSPRLKKKSRRRQAGGGSVDGPHSPSRRNRTKSLIDDDEDDDQDDGGAFNSRRAKSTLGDDRSAKQKADKAERQESAAAQGVRTDDDEREVNEEDLLESDGQTPIVSGAAAAAGAVWSTMRNWL